jgi:phosphate transport system substrate-binding protein
MPRVAAICFLLPCFSATAAESLRIQGAPTVNRAVARAAQLLRTERGMEIQITTTGGSAGGIAALGDGEVQMALSSRMVTAEERAEAPDVRFNEIYFGEHVVAFVVSADVWESGVHALSRQELLDIYEGRITNWKEVGGADQKIIFYNSEQGRGTWEIFAQWLYGDAKRARPTNFPTVANDEDTINSVGFTKGSMSQLSAALVDNKSVFALGIKDASGHVVEPAPANAANHAYPLTRPLYMVVNDRPTRSVKVMVDLMLSPRGQEFVKKEGYYTRDEIEAAGPRKTAPEFEILQP